MDSHKASWEGSMTELKTRESLLSELREKSSVRPNRKELHNQRVSFIIGALGENSAVTREKVELALAENAE